MSISNNSISIVVHGALFESTSSDLINALMQYRHAFKGAEIILSISSSDFVDFSLSTEESVAAHKKSMENVCRAINEYVDKIAYGYLAQPLPPVFRDAPNCHANHMIESARNGLNLATREYVLRVRNDLVFKDRSIVDKYEELMGRFYSSGPYTVFESPVMISSLFTLNPFAGGRLPFHYSDWFNFGRLSDIKPIWDVPLVTLDFMTFYNNNYYMAGSKEKERNFFSRTAIEQYVYYNFFSSHFDGLKLDFHNDDRSAPESIQILLDNFIVSDIFHLNVFYPKYYHAHVPFVDFNLRIMQGAWEFLSLHRDIDPVSFLKVSREDLRDHTPERFPLLIEADRLHSKTGFHFGKSLVIPYDAPPGVACFGPHITLKKGSYTADIRFSALYPEGDQCVIKVSATGEVGHITLDSKDYVVQKVDGYSSDFVNLRLDFDNYIDVLKNFEIVIETDGRIDMSIDFINISERPVRGGLFEVLRR